MVNFEIDFNPETFALGVAAGWASAYGVYRARHTLQSIRDSVTEQAESAQNYATRSSDSRYVSDLLREIETDHMGGKVASLTDVLIEPRFLPAPAFATPEDSDEAIYSVFHVVPHIADQPFLQAPYNVETMSIADLGRGSRAIALLGLPGSGRTTALYTIALWSLGRVTFNAPRDRVQEQIEAEDAELQSEEQSHRIRDRLQIEQMALQSLAKERGEDIEQDTALRQQASVPVFQRLSPIYVHLANLDHRTGEFSRSVDPAEPLVRAVQSQVGNLTARNIPGKFYERIVSGQALILIDGYDDIPEAERPAKLAWLQAFMREYGRNFMIVAGPTKGYGGLTQSGLTPVFLRPWMDVDTDTATEKWAAAWSATRGRRQRGDIDEKLLAHAKSQNRVRTPFELTLKLWSTFEDPERGDYEEQIRTAIQHFLPPEDAIGTILPELINAAVLQLNEGYFTADSLEAVAFATRSGQSGIANIDTQTDSDLPEEDLDALFAEISEPNAGEDTPADTAEPSDKAQSNIEKERATARKNLAKFLSVLHRSALLRRFSGDRYQFRHPLIAAYLASLSLVDADSETLLNKAKQPAWEDAVTYAALHMPLDEVVEVLLDTPDDVLHTNVLTVAQWLKYAPADAAWRRTTLRTLGNMFVAQEQFPLSRERAAAALIGTRDRSALVVFKRAIRHPEPDVRRLACLGIGAMRAEDGIEELSALLNDPDQNVQLAAGLALGAIGSEAAIDEMVGGLTEGSEQLRKAIAEAFAAIPEQGYPILYEAIREDIMELRRAAVFGLARINTSWALVTLYKVSLEDQQWYVRSAAEQAFINMQYGKTVSGAVAYPNVDTIPWLRSWLIEQGEDALKNNETGEDALLYALEHGDAEVQSLSLRNIGQLGMIDYISVLYRAMRHQHRGVREAAYRALGELQQQVNLPLPAPS